MKTSKSCCKLSHYFSGCLYFTAGHLYREIERMAFEVFKPIGMAPTQAFMIMVLYEQGGEGGTPSELSEIMNLDRSTVTRLMSFLVKNRLVKVVKNGKFKKIYLTSKGVNLVPEIRRAWKNLYDMYCKEWGKKKANAINKSILRNLGTIGT